MEPIKTLLRELRDTYNCYMNGQIDEESACTEFCATYSQFEAEVLKQLKAADEVAAKQNHYD